MWILIVSLLLLGLVAGIVGYVRNRRLHQQIERGDLDRMPEVKPVNSVCCGQHAICERDSLLAGISKKIEYYDDEELDRFAGRKEDTYSDEEAGEFGEIFYTMKETDVAGWLRSLQLRGVTLPLQIKDEVMLVVEERRSAPVL